MEEDEEAMLVEEDDVEDESGGIGDEHEGQGVVEFKRGD